MRDERLAAPPARASRVPGSPSAVSFPEMTARLQPKQMLDGLDVIVLTWPNTTRALFTVLWAVWLCVAAGCGARMSRNREAEDQAAIKKLEQEWAAATPRHDAKVYAAVLADDFVGQWADGSQSGKREMIDDLASGRDVYQSNVLGPVDIRVYGDTAVVTGSFTEESTLSGRSGSGRYSFLDVWVRRNGRWQVVAFKSLKLEPTQP